jgi:hypothetical protein
LSIFKGQIDLKPSRVINLREWLIIPGRLLFIEFYINFRKELKGWINDEFINNKTPDGDKLSVDIAKRILQYEFSSQKVWYPLAANLATRLVKKFKPRNNIDWNSV